MNQSAEVAETKAWPGSGFKGFKGLRVSEALKTRKALGLRTRLDLDFRDGMPLCVRALWAKGDPQSSVK